MTKSTDLPESSGKHLICDIKNIKNVALLNSLEELKKMLDEICETHQYTILRKTHHSFTPQGTTILYLLSESHISIHTFPERSYAAMDIYTCRDYPDHAVYHSIQSYLSQCFDSSDDHFVIVDRMF